MPTKLTYLTKPNLLETTANLLETGTSEKGRYAIFDQTIFYPRGGGQESDNGKIQLTNPDTTIDITFVGFSEGKVYHFGNFPDNCELNQSATLQINKTNRQSNSALHTAGHLIASIIETKTDYLRAVKGFHFPNGSYVEFNILKDTETENKELIQLLNETIAQDIKKEWATESQKMTLAEIKQQCTYVPENLPTEKPLRVVTIENYFPIPCGGTHVKSLASLAGLQVYKVKKKKGNLKISYRIEETD